MRGIERLIEDERYCIDILTQVAAVTTLLESLALRLLSKSAVALERVAKLDTVVLDKTGTLTRGESPGRLRQRARAQALASSALRRDLVIARVGGMPGSFAGYGSRATSAAVAIAAGERSYAS